jgi:CBS domain-containing protein
MTVGDLGPEEVVTVDRDATVDDVVEKLGSENVGSVVVTEDDEPVGIVTDRDVALSVSASDDPASASVEDVMTEEPVTLQEDEPNVMIARAIEEHNVRRIPVVDDDGKVTGIVTLDDLVATVGEQLEQVGDTIETQSPDYEP